MEKRSSGGGGSFLFVLLLVFLVLKLTGVIDWSWWWVTSPLWLPAALVLAGLALMAVLGVSVYKVVAAALRRQNVRPSSPHKADVLEVHGSEVTVPADDDAHRLELPAAPAADGPADTPAPQTGGPSS